MNEERSKLVALAALAAVAAGGAALVLRQRGTTKNVSVVAARLTLAGDDGSAVREVRRESRPDVYYRVTLNDAPRGQRLALDCEWMDPSGQRFLQNHYETQTISTTLWNTHCHQRLGPDAPVGTWTVRMMAGTRMLSSESFAVK